MGSVDELLVDDCKISTITKAHVFICYFKHTFARGTRSLSHARVNGGVYVKQQANEKCPKNRCRLTILPRGDSVGALEKTRRNTDNTKYRR